MAKIEIRSNIIKDFQDADLDEAIETALNDYSKYYPKILTATYTVNTNNSYDLPSGYIWIKEIRSGDSKLLFEIRDNKLKLKTYDIPSYQDLLQTSTITDSINGLESFDVIYTKRKEIVDLETTETEKVLLRADAECDSILINEPYRYTSKVINFVGVETLKISDVYQKAYDSKMKEYKQQVQGGYGVRA